MPQTILANQGKGDKYHIPGRPTQMTDDSVTYGNVTFPVSAFRLRPLSWVLKMVPYCKQAIYAKMAKKEFPQSIRLGGNRVAWKESDILEWITAKEQASKTA